MKKNLFYWSLIALCIFIFSCTQDEIKEKKKLAQINDYVLTLDEFQVQLAEELEFDKEFKLTKKTKKDFLDGLITKEILIQEHYS